MIKLRYIMFVGIVLLALALSAMITVPVLADDSVPPPTETPTVETPPTIDVTEAAPPSTEVLPAEAPPQESTEAGVLASLPEGTDLVVLDESGNALPLATMEAADILEDPDPLWCPAGVAPKPNSMNTACSPDGISLSNLLTLGGEPYANGTLWIQHGDDLGTDVDFSAWAAGAAYSLTLQGGWSGIYGSTALYAPDPYSYFDTSITIDWGGAVTLNNIVFNGVTSGDALTILTEGTITLNNVDVVDNPGGDGAYLNNTFGAGNVVVNDSTFNGNNGYGLRVYSNGTITTKNLSANNNNWSGAWLDNSFATIAKAVTLTGSNNFNHNGWDGLVVYSNGAITLNNVTAIYNTIGHGVYLDNCDYNYVGQYCNNSLSSAVIVKGTNNFSNNGWDGLRVWSHGAITLSNITANNNGTDPSRPGASDPADPFGTGKYDGTGKGVYLYNWVLPAKSITLIGTNKFNNNAETGLYMRSYGFVTLNNITANNNGHNCNSPTAICDGMNIKQAQGIKLLGYGVFNGNLDDGLEVHSSLGAITLNNLYAENNGYWGVLADSWGIGSAVNVLGTNTFINNTDSGLHIWSEGAVTLSNITANDNGVDGVYVYNAYWNTVPNPDVQIVKPVTLTGTNFFNGNAVYGLEVHSFGVITTNNVTAVFNIGNGVKLDNCLYDPDPLVNDCTALPGKAVTMNGNNNINDNNGEYGLWIESLGAIKVNNLTASFNGATGASLDNNWNRSIGGVTITGFANVSGNGNRGLGIYSHGAILLSNLTVNGNGEIGARLYNGFDPLKPMNVTLLGVNQFNDNWYTGLRISSNGVVVLYNVTANSNGDPTDPAPYGWGADIDNSSAATAKAVTLNGINIFNGNFDDGLSIQSKGAIVVNKVTANYNGGNGAYLDNQFNFVNSALTLLGYGTFNGNGDTGLVVYSNGNITLNNVTSNYSTGGGGAYIDNWSKTTTPVFVTLLGVNSFISNAGNTGLVVYSDGAITLNNVTANDNNGDGAYLNNTTYQIPLKVANITLNGTNTFISNFYDGLAFDATGNVILTRIIADFNDGYANSYDGSGVFGFAGGSITFTCGSLTNNQGYGYALTAGIGKLITLKGVFTYGNGFGNYSSFPTVSTRTCPLP